MFLEQRIGGSICSSNKHKFSRRAYRHVFSRKFLSHRTHTIFQETPIPRTDILLIGPGGCFRNWVVNFLFKNYFMIACAKSCVVDLALLNLATVCSSNTCHIPRVPVYFSLKHIINFQKALTCSSNTYEFSRSFYFLIEQISIFQEALCHRKNRHFPGRYSAVEQTFQQLRSVSMQLITAVREISDSAEPLSGLQKKS